jgi:N4-gp56 family major capsid protein
MIDFNWLQLFADAGTVVNTLVNNGTSNYTNAYTGDAVAANPSTNTLAPELKTFYDTELLENARTEMFYAQFGRKQHLPKNGGTTIEWRKFNTFDRASELKEGVIPTGQQFGSSSLTASISQYGTYTSITDKLEMRAYDNVILAATEEMGASAAATQETLIRNALLVGTNVMYCDNIDADGNKLSTPTTPATMGAGGSTAGTGGASTPDGWALLTPTMVNKAVTKMKKDRVPRINGKYYAVIHPSVAYDLRQSKEWIEVHKYAATGEIFNGEIGELHGCRFIEDTFAPILGGSYTYSGSTTYKNKSNGVTYATYFFGKDGFGIVDPEGGGLEMIIHDKDEIGGPLNQFSTIGYKFETNGATILYPERVLRVMSVSSYSATDEENK